MILLLAKRALYKLLQLVPLLAKTGGKAWHVLCSAGGPSPAPCKASRWSDDQQTIMSSVA